MYLFLIKRLGDLAKNINEILNVFCIFDINFFEIIKNIFKDIMEK